MKIQATNKATGEIIELDANTPEQIVAAWRTAQEYAKAADSIKDQLKKIVPTIVAGDGKSEEINGYMFRVSAVQRYNYDKSVMRRVLDEDVFDILMKPDKTATDKYLKEHLMELGDASTELRNSMLAEGNPYQVIKLEKL